MEPWIKQRDCGSFEVKTDTESVWCVTSNFYHAVQLCRTINTWRGKMKVVQAMVDKLDGTILLTDIVP